MPSSYLSNLTSLNLLFIIILSSTSDDLSQKMRIAYPKNLTEKCASLVLCSLDVIKNHVINLVRVKINTIFDLSYHVCFVCIYN